MEADLNHVLDYAPSPARSFRWPRVSRATITLLGAGSVLSACSTGVVFQYANREPFMGGVSKSDALFYVGFGTGLVLLWAVWCVLVVARLYRERDRWSAWWIVPMLWACLNVLYVASSIDGYLNDVIMYLRDYLP